MITRLRFTAAKWTEHVTSHLAYWLFSDGFVGGNYTNNKNRFVIFLVLCSEVSLNRAIVALNIIQLRVCAKYV